MVERRRDHGLVCAPKQRLGQFSSRLNIMTETVVSHGAEEQNRRLKPGYPGEAMQAGDSIIVLTQSIISCDLNALAIDPPLGSFLCRCDQARHFGQ